MKIKNCILLILFFVFMGCGFEPSDPIIMKFEVGEIVKFKIDDRPIFIFERTDYDLEYKVSFFAAEYTRVWVKEMELEPFPSKKDSVITKLLAVDEFKEFKDQIQTLIEKVEKE